MPRSAIGAGCVDFVLTPERIAKEISQISRHPYVGFAPRDDAAPLVPEGEDELGPIFRLLRTASGVDFTYYRKSTIKRRVARRMALHNFDRLSAYLKHLEGNRQELDALFQDILIHVTTFFRGPKTYLALQDTILPRILAVKSKGEAIRMWVPGCSTGEEVYSIAMCLLENLGDRVGTTPIQIFGTDVADKAIESARSGIYPASLLQDVSPKRLKRFFTSSAGNHYQVSTALRDVCVFARHDLTRDPPFSRLDLISCRNVLIYLEPVLQKRVLTSFHYALKDKGFLVLGESETLGGFPELFRIVDRKNKFFTKKPMTEGTAYAMGSASSETRVPPLRPPLGATPAYDFEKEADRVVWELYSHAGVVVDHELQILLIRGDTSPYLRPAPGRPSFSLLKMLREDLVFEVRGAIQKAMRAGTAVRREAIRLKEDERFREINIEIRPLKVPGARATNFLVLFETAGPLTAALPEPPATGRKRKADAGEALKLNTELKRTREYLQAIIQEQETTNEELKSANEEALSSMEELQSTNEELETAKEELQSSNEELTTLNEQAQNRNAELARITDDLTNVLDSLNIPILLMGGNLRIRSFTPSAGKLLHLLPGDVGRPLGDIRLRIDLPDTEKLISEVIALGDELRRDVRAEDGRWYSARIHPFRTGGQTIDGVLMAFVDVDDLKQSQAALREEKSLAAAILEAAGRALLVVVLDREGRILHFNRACQELTGYSLDEATGRRPWDFLTVPEEARRVEDVFSELVAGVPNQYENQWLTKEGGRRVIVWRNSLTAAEDGRVQYVIGTGIDITDEREAKALAEQSDATVQALLETAAQAILAVDRDGRIMLANLAAGAMFGYERSELVGKQVESLIPPRFGERHAGHRTAYFQAPTVRSMGAGFDLSARRRDGTEFPVEVSLSHLATGDVNLAVAFISDITERKQSEDILRRSEARLRALTEGLLTAQEEERKRLSRDLHDDFNQRMAMLAVGVAELEAGLPDSERKIRDHLLALEASLTEVSDDLRRTAYQLHPSVLEHLGLAAALEAYCEDVSKLGAIKVRFRRHRVPQRIPEAVALCLYRVAQECLRNVIKHAGTATASVELAGKGDQLVLTVSDSGRGFDPKEAALKGGLGMVSMEERVRLAAGTVSIRTRPGDGTHVTIQVPLKPGRP